MYSNAIKLRSYQSDIVDRVRNLMSLGNRRMLVVSPVGSGKTLLTAFMLASSAEKGFRSIFLVHRRELIEQSSRAFSSIGLKHGIISAGFEQNSAPLVQIASVQTLVKRLDKIIEPKILIYDEAHHCAAKSWREIHSRFFGAHHIGLTATPVRLDGKGLRDYFDLIVEGPKVRWLIEHGFLSSYKAFAPNVMAGVKLPKRAGDYMLDVAASVLNKPTLTGDVIEHYKRHLLGKRAIVFCSSVQHSIDVVSQFNQSNILAEHVDANTPAKRRAESIEAYRQNAVKILSNVNLFGEGFDVPSTDGVILLRPTASFGLHHQMIGRALRFSETKSHAVILDHVGNISRHGFPDDESEWTLDGFTKGDKEASLSIKICPKCYAAQRLVMVCGFCGYKWPVQMREQIRTSEGELVEISKEDGSMKADLKRLMTFDDLVTYGKARGFKRPYLWAKHVYNNSWRKSKWGPK